MDSADLATLGMALTWLRAGREVSLLTVVKTWGSAPRPIGAIAAIRDDGIVAGSVSGGCVEDDLVTRLKERACAHAGSTHVPQLISYGLSREEASRFGLPCGGTLQLVCESLTNTLADTRWLEEVIARCECHEIVARTVDMQSGSVRISTAYAEAALSFDERYLTAIYGPRWRLLLIGAGDLSRYVTQIARTLEFEVFICDPREEYRASRIPGARYVPGMPDDVVLMLEPDCRTAIVALTHDPKLDDMALLEALRSDAFYIGALGSRRNTQLRKARLALFDLRADEIERLHGPVGLRIGSRTPPEIAVSIMAEVIAVRNTLSWALEQEGNGGMDAHRRPRASALTSGGARIEGETP
ncbi:MAG TPA: XdhC family protein [Rhodocyclaceae bacterium]|nr:XdhC family protein [Rhodocyclaceae bacterium]